MIKKILVLAMLSGTSFAAAAQRQAQVPQTLEDGYKLVWNDEFDSPGHPNPANWTYETGFVRNNEWQWYQAENAIVTEDGILQITARNEDRPCPWFAEGSTEWRNSRKRIECTSASIITKGLHEFLYGRFIVRARIPISRGSWPAIWMLGHSDKYGWPSCGEVDIMEYYPAQGIPSLLANAFWGDDNGRPVKDVNIVPLAHFTEKDPLWATQFHTWRMDWDEDFIRLYLDDELLNEVDLSTTINGKHGHGNNPFHAPMYLLLNLAVGSNGGNVDADAMPMRYEIDYVRVYQK